MGTYTLVNGTTITIPDHSLTITYGDILNVEDLGLKGDGSDESSLLSTIILNMSFGSTLYFPKGNKGNYCIGSVLPAITQRCKIVFDIGASLNALNDLPYILKITASNCVLDGVYLGDNGFSVPKLCWFYGSTGNEILHFQTKGTGANTGLYFDDQIDSNNGCWVQTIIAPRIHMADNAGSVGMHFGLNCNSIRVLAPQIHHCGTGIEITDTLASFGIFGGDIENNVNYGIKLQTSRIVGLGLNQLGLYNVYFEFNGLADIYFPTENAGSNIFPLLARGMTIDNCYFEVNAGGSFLDHIYIGDANLAVHDGIFVKSCRFGNKGATVNAKCIDCFEMSNWTLVKTGAHALHLHRMGSSINGDHIEIETTSQYNIKGVNTADCQMILTGAYTANIKAASGVNTLLGSTNFESAVLGGGIVCKTPDGSKRYLLSVSNAGAVTATLL